ncbi:hypothetical protein [uncultured Microbacterium sp.]|uniref:hypothetical protein n=1 Tax=uncultured Microbacterium sp. TaxID=191216 RepID=UPI002607C1DF|nr:hypothetical protein [uncultured Microbacterium sp.]
MNRIAEVVLIESSAFDSPFADPHEVVEGAREFVIELQKWLPEINVVLVFPRAEVISPYLRDLRTHLDLVGVRVATRVSKDDLSHRERMRTRQLWEVRGVGSPGGRLPFHPQPDRRRVFDVALGKVVNWQTVADAVIQYAAVMAIPVGTLPPLEDEREF